MAVWLRAKPMGRTLCGFVRQHAYGNADTLPDHARIAWMLALITINMDLSVPVLYTAIIETSYGCNMFTLYGIYYGISQANFAMPVVCGWTSDWLGPWSHAVLLVCCVILSLLQAATLVVTDVWLLGAIFVVRQWLINQAVVQSYKLMAIRAHKVQLNPHVCCVRARRSTTPPSLLQVFADDEERKEQECQRTGATADFWTSLGEGVAYCVVYFMPPRSSRIALVMMAVASTVLVAMLAATYRISDLADDVPANNVPVKHNLATASTTASSEHTALLASRGVGSEATPCCSCRRGSPLRRFAE